MGTLVIHVVDAYDDSPVPNANVRVYSSSGRPVGVEVTDHNGIAVINMPDVSGEYVVEVKDQIHFDKKVTISYPMQRSIKVKLVKRTWGK